MGHNLGSAILMGNKRRREVTASKKSNPTIGDSNTSTWHANEDSILEDMEEGENPLKAEKLVLQKEDKNEGIFQTKL